MKNERLLDIMALQEAVFEAIKAKHENLYKGLSSKSDPLLLELADMILLFSAQLALASGIPVKQQAPGTDETAESESLHRPSTLLS